MPPNIFEEIRSVISEDLEVEFYPSFDAFYIIDPKTNRSFAMTAHAMQERDFLKNFCDNLRELTDAKDKN